MVNKKDALINPSAPSCQFSGSWKMFFRSASWSSSRTSGQISKTEDKDLEADPKGNDGPNNGQARRFPPLLTLCSQQIIRPGRVCRLCSRCRLHRRV